jgi:hypothetical protein
MFTLTNPARRESKTLMFEGFADGPDPSQRVVLARGGAVDQIIRITPSAFHAGAVADIALLPPAGQQDLPDIWDRLGTVPAVRIGPTSLEILARQASAFKPWTNVQVRKGEKVRWETVTLVSATTTGTPAVRWASSRWGEMESQSFSAVNADEAEGWQIRAEQVAPVPATQLEESLLGCIAILLFLIIMWLTGPHTPPERARH